MAHAIGLDIVRKFTRDIAGAIVAEQARTLPMAMMVFMPAPIVAPYLGEIVAAFGGWRAVFVALVALALPIWTVVMLLLPETCPPEQRLPIQPASVGAKLQKLAGSVRTMGNTAIAILIYGVMFGVIGIAPIIYAHTYDISSGFAGYFATLGAGIAIAAFTNARLVVRHGPARILSVALLALTTIAIMFLIACLVAKSSFWLFHMFMMALMCTKGLIFADCNALAVDPHRDFAGFASSMIGGMTMLGGAVVAHAIGGSYSGDVVLIAAA